MKYLLLFTSSKKKCIIYQIESKTNFNYESKTNIFILFRTKYSNIFIWLFICYKI